MGANAALKAKCHLHKLSLKYFTLTSKSCAAYVEITACYCARYNFLLTKRVSVTLNSATALIKSYDYLQRHV
jgi:hypothetical protein